jgi:hypothetical protein
MAAHVAGVPATRIARAFNTSYHTIIALVRNRPEALDKARQYGGQQLENPRGCRHGGTL